MKTTFILFLSGLIAWSVQAQTNTCPQDSTLSIMYNQNMCLAGFSFNVSQPNQLITWDFGDGTTQTTTIAYAQHVYAEPGEYTVCAWYTSTTCSGIEVCGTAIMLCDPNAVYGCTDPAASNYIPSATVDDGSCFYPELCEFTVIDSTDFYCGAIYMIANSPGPESYYWFVNSELVSLGALLLYEAEPGTYNIFCQRTGNCANYVLSFTAEVQACEEGNCTDPTATNYNPLALFNDGSCEYDFCSVSFDAVADSLNPGTLTLLLSGALDNAIYILWDFGDGNSSNVPYPTHTYDDDGPYLLCLTTAFVLSSGDTCMNTYCALVDASMVEGSEFDTGFTIQAFPFQSLGASGRQATHVLKLWPNPASDFVRISIPQVGNEMMQLSLVDIRGKLLLSQNINAPTQTGNIEIPLSGLASGVYFISISNISSRYTGKVVVQR